MAQFRNNNLRNLSVRFFFEEKPKHRGKSRGKRPRSDLDLEPKTYQFRDPKESANQEHNFARAEELTNPLSYLFINAIKNVSLLFLLLSLLINCLQGILINLGNKIFQMAVKLVAKYIYTNSTFAAAEFDRHKMIPMSVIVFTATLVSFFSL